MEKRRAGYMALGFGLLLLVVTALLFWGGRRQSGGIVLPEIQSDGPGTDGDMRNSRLNVIAVTPETVGAAIGALARPAAYSRSQTAETFWSGGSGLSVSQIYVSGSRTRLDTALPDGSVRHTLIEDGDPPLAGVWYDDETEWVRLRAGDLAADRAARTPTYETVRDLPPEDILLADYRDAFGGPCVYVEVRPGGDGDYLDRYWVSVDSGLLAAAERLWRGGVVYRFSAGEPEIAPQDESLFLTPDGALAEPG